MTHTKINLKRTKSRLPLQHYIILPPYLAVGGESLVSGVDLGDIRSDTSLAGGVGQLLTFITDLVYLGLVVPAVLLQLLTEAGTQHGLS